MTLFVLYQTRIPLSVQVPISFRTVFLDRLIVSLLDKADLARRPNRLLRFIVDATLPSLCLVEPVMLRCVHGARPIAERKVRKEQ